MKKLYYATFEKGFSEQVKKIIRKLDKNSKIKTIYDDAVLFFADEHFKFVDSCFFDAFLVIQNVHKTGVGALNLTIKNLLEKKELKISFPKNVGVIKLTIKKENEKIAVDSKLKNAFEVMVKRVTKKNISFLAKDEIMLQAKADGENLFMKRLATTDKFVGLANKYDIRPETAYILAGLSEPQSNEVVLDAFAGNGVMSFVRGACFVKANAIAATDIESEKENLKRLAKKSKNAFSVLGYDFLDESFSIKFIDKIVTNLTDLCYGNIDAVYDFFDKAFELKVKLMVLVVPKNYAIGKFVSDKFEVLEEINADKFNAYKLKLIG